MVIMIFFDFCSNLSSYLSRGSIFGGDEIDVVELELKRELGELLDALAEVGKRVFSEE